MDQLQEFDKSGNRITGQPKDGAFPDLAEEKWFTWLYCDSPDVDLSAKGPQRCLNQVVFPHRNAAGDDKNVILNSELDRFDQRFALVATMFRRFHRRAASLQQDRKSVV